MSTPATPPPSPSKPDSAASTGAAHAPATNGAAAGAPAARSYKDTLNLPKTTFPMKANLVQNEPASIKRWASLPGTSGQGLYQATREKHAGAPAFSFHDGPPYANGNIHMGHLMNKCLKDFVVRTRTMMGMDCPYVPGWDCHGLPIEHKVMTELVEAGKMQKLASLPDDQRKMAVRRECQKYAEKFVKLQAAQMERLLTLADYAHPYMTMAPAYEGATLEVLADLVEQGLVYRALKPVHWSIANETALAEAELEYYDREDLSVYVDLEALDAEAVYDAFGLKSDENEEEDEDEEEPGEKDELKSKAPKPGTRPLQRPSFMVWTTTPWTLPANVGIAVSPKIEYALAWIDGSVTVLAANLVEKVAAMARAEEAVVLATTTGDRLLGLRYRHPFVSTPPACGLGRSCDPAKLWSVVAADYVTTEDGTGLVHTAPGHGTEDYATGLREGLPVYSPVRGDGTYDETAPEWLRGVSVWDANKKVAEWLRNSGHLFFDHTFTHSYPHDWRSKTPVIFRCTEQWFVGVDKSFLRSTDHDSSLPQSLRDRALESVDEDWEQGRTERQRTKIDVRESDTLRLLLQGREDQGVPESIRTALPPRTAEDAVKVAAELARVAIQHGITPARAVAAITAGLFHSGDKVVFVPEWGKNRMAGMLESRPDWCISRQRAWGLPIPAFTTPEGGTLLTAASIRAVAKVFREKGSDAWFQAPPEELLKYYDPAVDPDPSGRTVLGSGEASGSESRTTSERGLKKGNDILDVWFESGSSWNSVLRERGLAYPADLYLEGSDQHRGWFQLSLLTSLGATGRPPFKALLTHGFLVDKHGKKMSKSLGNDIKVEDLLKDHGADVCRWWVASLGYENDVKVDMEFFNLAGESYRKVRNTLRFMLSNLDDFTGPLTVDAGHFPSTSIDAWVLGEFKNLSVKVVAAYGAYDFRGAHEAVYTFCNTTLSAVYLAAVKDRLYCDRPDSVRRRRTQLSLAAMTDGLCRLLAPVLCHTADEAYRSLHKARPDDPAVCVHLATFVESFAVNVDPSWAAVMTASEQATKTLESAKASLGVENPLDAGVVLPDPDGTLAKFDRMDLADLLGVSRVELDGGATSLRILDLRGEPRCERSWKRDGTVKARADGSMLSERDAEAVGVA